MTTENKAEQAVLDENIYENLVEASESEKTDEPVFSKKEQKKIQQELQKHFWKFKRQFKAMSKSELIAIIWEQGMQYKKLQDIAQELYKENKSLKGEKNDKETTEEIIETSN